MWVAQVGAAEMSHGDHSRFSTHVEIVPVVGDTRVIQFATTTDFWARSRAHVAQDEREDFIIGFDRSRTPQTLRQGTRELTLQRGSVMVHTNAVASETRTGGDVSWLLATAPRAQIVARVPDADNRIMTLLDGRLAAMRHLERYLEFLLSAPALAGEPMVAAHASILMLDLMVLALGATGDEAELASTRGLRAARLHDVLALIERHYAEPAFSTDVVATSLGISRRYVNDLLSESGTGFTERLMELRLQKAQQMLADPARNRMKVSDIAFDCGFNEVSYFNRSFRARFGCSPTQARGG